MVDVDEPLPVLDAFADFVVRLAAEQGFDLGGAVFLGYSNGANVISSLMLTDRSQCSSTRLTATG